MRGQSSDGAPSSGRGVPRVASPPSRKSMRSSGNGAPPPARASSPPTTPPPPTAAVFSSKHPNPISGIFKATPSFLQRVVQVRKPAFSQQQPTSGTESDMILSSGATAVSPDSGQSHASSAPPPAVVTETEVIEPAALGSLMAPLTNEDPLDTVVAPPLLDRNAVTEYVAKANNWLLTDGIRQEHQEFVSRGLLMIRNVVRSEPRYAAQESVNWLPIVRDNLVSKHGIIRAAAASALAAFAASTPGREVIQTDPHVLHRLMQMLTSGLVMGGDNNDTQYSCLALANVALNSSCKQALVHHGALPRAADVLRAAIRHLNGLHTGSNALPHGGGGSMGGNRPRNDGMRATTGSGTGGGAGRQMGAITSPILKSAAYMTTMLSSWAVEPTGRDQMQQYDVSRLAHELHGRCCSELGDDFPLSQRLALLVETSRAAELLEEIAEAAEGMEGPMNAWAALWKHEDPDLSTGAIVAVPHSQPNPHAGALRGVSFMDTGNRSGTSTGTGTGSISVSRSRASLAMNSLHRLVESEMGCGSPSSTNNGAPISVPTSSNVHRSISKKHMAVSAATAATNNAIANAIANANSNSNTSSQSLVASNSQTWNNSVGTPPTFAYSSATPGITTNTTVSTTAAASAPLNPALMYPRDSATSGNGNTSSARSSRMLSSRASHQGLLGSSSSLPLGAAASTVQFMPSSAHHQSTFSETGSHALGGCIPPTSPSQSQSQLQYLTSPVQQLSTGGSMLGVHFSASVFQEAASATAIAARASLSAAAEDEISQRRNMATPFLATQSSSKSFRLPTVRSGRLSFTAEMGAQSPTAAGSRGSPLLQSRSSEPPLHIPLGVGGSPGGVGRLELPFHLVRPVSNVSASAGKVSRISAAYGQVASARKGGSTAHSTTSYPRGNTGEM